MQEQTRSLRKVYRLCQEAFIFSAYIHRTESGMRCLSFELGRYPSACFPFGSGFGLLLR